MLPRGQMRVLARWDKDGGTTDFHVTKAVFTLGRNMSETCSALKSVYTRRGVARIMIAGNMFILSMIEGTSRGSFDPDQMKDVTCKSGEHVETTRMLKRFTIGLTVRPKCLVKIRVDVAK